MAKLNGLTLNTNTAALSDALAGFSVNIHDPNNTLDASQLSLLKLDARYAANQWMSHFNNKGEINIEINVQKPISGHPADARPGTEVQIGSTSVDVPMGPLKQHMAWNVMQAGTINEMLTGRDPNGAGPDIIINIDPEVIKGGYLNPHPFQTRGDVPAGQSDIVSLLLHEMGHGFGIGDSYRDPKTGELQGAVNLVPSGVDINYNETVWDKLVNINADGSATFLGVNAFQANGNFFAAVTTLNNGEQYQHFGNDLRDYHNQGSDLMTGIGLYKQMAYDISDYDLAVLKDLGAPVKVPVLAVEHSIDSVIGINHKVAGLALQDASSLANYLAHSTVDTGRTGAHDAIHALTAVTNAGSSLAVDFAHLTGNIVQATNHAASAIGNDVVHTVENGASDVIHGNNLNGTETDSSGDHDLQALLQHLSGLNHAAHAFSVPGLEMVSQSPTQVEHATIYHYAIPVNAEPSLILDYHFAHQLV